MKKLLQLFGILDLLAIFGMLNQLLFHMKGSPFIWLTITMWILALSFVASGYLLIKTNVWGIYLNYLQFIPRLSLYAGSSLSIVYLISEIFEVYLSSYSFLFIPLAVIECLRLGVTIYIHLKNKKHTLLQQYT